MLIHFFKVVTLTIASTLLQHFPELLVLLELIFEFLNTKFWASRDYSLNHFKVFIIDMCRLSLPEWQT